MEQNTRIKEEKNIRLFPIYRMIAIDYLFFYAIQVLFLTQTKEIPVTDVLLSNSFYAFFRALFQIPIIVLIEKMGKKKSVILGNLASMIYILLLIFCTNFSMLMLAQVFAGFAFSIKGVAEPAILTSSLPDGEKKGEQFAKTNGRGYSGYYYLNAVSAVIAGFLFSINTYIPMVLCLLVCLLATYLSTKFTEIPVTTQDENSEEIHFKSYMRGLKSSFRVILKSKRLKALLLFSGMMWGIMYLFDTYEVDLLQKMNVPAQVIGIMVAILNVISGMSSKRQEAIHKRFRNKTLSYVGLSYTIACIVGGILVICKVPFYPCLILVFMTYMIRYADQGLDKVLTVRYLGNFAKTEVSTKIFAVDNLLGNMARMIIGILGSWLLKSVSIEYAFVLAGCTATLLILWITEYMKGRTGLKPEEYSKQEILYQIPK